MKPLLPSKPGTAYEVRRTGRTETGVDEASRTAAAPGPLASFARFILCGGSVGLACGPAVALLAALMPWALANALVTAASTILCTQLHARFTFEAGRRAGWRQHWQSAGSASAGYAVTCAAMFILDMVQPSAGTLSEQAVYLSASGLAGIGRFLVLRLFVFAGSPTTVQENSPAGVQEASESASWPIATPVWPKATRSASERAIMCDQCRLRRTSSCSALRTALKPAGLGEQVDRSVPELSRIGGQGLTAYFVSGVHAESHGAGLPGVTNRTLPARGPRRWRGRSSSGHMRPVSTGRPFVPGPLPLSRRPRTADSHSQVPPARTPPDHRAPAAPHQMAPLPGPPQTDWQEAIPLRDRASQSC